MDIRIIGAVILIAATALLILTEVAKRAYTHELASLLEQGEVRAYLALLEKPLVKLVFPAWNRSFMQLNGYLALDAYGEADSVIERMLSMRQNDRQRRELVGKAFNYYLERGNAEGATRLLAEIETWEDADAVAEARMMHDIYIKKGWGYIEDMERRVEGLHGVDRGFLELLLALQYENKGDAAASERYLKRSEKHMRTPVKG